MSIHYFYCEHEIQVTTNYKQAVNKVTILLFIIIFIPMDHLPLSVFMWTVNSCCTHRSRSCESKIPACCDERPIFDLPSQFSNTQLSWAISHHHLEASEQNLSQVPTPSISSLPLITCHQIMVFSSRRF